MIISDFRNIQSSVVGAILETFSLSMPASLGVKVVFTLYASLTSEMEEILLLADFCPRQLSLNSIVISALESENPW